MKSDPEKALTLREAYEDIVIPGYYSNKKHWNSIFLDADVEDLKRAVGFEPSTPLADGVARWAEWFRAYVGKGA